MNSSSSSSLDLSIPAGTRCYRTSLSLPAELAIGLNQLAKSLGISQSALVTALLSQAVPDLQALVDSVPEGFTPDDPDVAKRFRGDSIDYVMRIVGNVLKEL